ncbi:cupin domain-containing protein [Bacillus sp. ISL-47]|uniref:cupin domain-containing protein n=1 Tax=Bacillus sp. ISL-47 TaxID=2819130 RepID=UPI002035DDC7|nr:cupin domain-containing protein [Bacillus sp. ISL-47]
MYYTNYMPRNQQDHQQVCEAILGAIKREASAIELCRQLANEAPNQQHFNEIHQAIAGKVAHLTQFTNLFISLTGTQPDYQIDQVPFQNYREGLQKAYQSEVEGYQEYHKSSILTEHPQIRNVFLWALSGEQENAVRFCSLNEEIAKRQTDFGPEPFVVDIEDATTKNNNFRTALWTGEHLQLTLMSIGVGEDIGLEIHPELDQFLRVEEGQGIIRMGDSKDQLDFEEKVSEDFAIIIPAGKWHNLINSGYQPLKLYSIYAPPQHPFGTVHKTKAEALAAEEEHHSN